MKYELRTLCSKDIFPLSKIIDKIGFSELKGIFSKPEIQKAIQTGNESAVGISTAIELVSIVLNHLESIEEDLYKWLASVTGESVNTLRNDSMSDFVELLIAIVQKEEFADFIQVVSRFVKPVE